MISTKQNLIRILQTTLVMTALLLAAVNTRAVVFTNLYDFNISYNGDEGPFPNSGLLLSGNTLYGTTPQGGSYGYGTVFAVNIDGTGFTNLYSFDETNGDYPFGTLVMSGNTLYGTTSGFGGGGGTVFSINTDGTGFTNLYIFYSVDGQTPNGLEPIAGLTLSGNTLYGTSSGVGPFAGSFGAVFSINTDGTGFTNLYSFSEPIGDGGLDTIGTNSDGAQPIGVLTLSGNTLYGTTAFGGTNGYGTVFAVNTDGTGFTNLHNFAQFYYNSSLGSLTNSDGDNPVAGLILSGNTLYGTAQVRGFYGSGTVFAVNTDGTDFTNLYNFTAGPTGRAGMQGRAAARRDRVGEARLVRFRP